MKVALVQDYLNDYGGAERVLETLAQIYPNAPVFTIAYNPEVMPSFINKLDIHTSFVQKLPEFVKKRREFLPILASKAVASFDFSGFDVVISSSSAYSKGVKTSKDIIHLSYTHSIMNFVWHWHDKYFSKKIMGIKKYIAKPFVWYMRKWDLKASKKPDMIIANSEYTRQMIWRYYHRSSEMIYPPVKLSDFYISEPEDYFLVVARLEVFKEVELATEAFNILGFNLKIIGDGPQKEYLKNIAGKNIEFLGEIRGKKLADYYSKARALINLGEETFGLTVTESMASGRPVLSIKKGGAKEIIKEDMNGEFFDKLTRKSLIECVKRFIEKESEYNPERIRESVKKFDEVVFKENIKKLVDKELKRKEK